MCKLDKGHYTKVHFLVEWLNNCFFHPISVECLFSIAGKVLRPERCSLKDGTFEKLKIIKLNLSDNNLKVAD